MPGSRSSRMADVAYEELKKSGVDVELINFVNLDLPICDGNKCFEHAQVQELAAKVKAADGVLIALPVHNYNVAASAKNLTEILTVDAWSQKTIGFIVAAGGDYSYLAVMSLATSFMVDYRCTIIPRFVYASFKDFEQDKAVSEGTIKRIHGLCEDVMSYTQALMPIKKK